MHLVPPPGNGRSQFASPSSRGLRAPKRARRFSAFAVLGGGASLRRIRRVASCAVSVERSSRRRRWRNEAIDLAELDRREHVPAQEPRCRVDRISLGVCLADDVELDAASGEAAGARTNDDVHEAGHPPAHCLGCRRRGRALAVLGQRGEIVALDHAERSRVEPALRLVPRGLHVK